MISNVHFNKGKFVEVVGPIEIKFVLQIPSVKIISIVC